MMNYRVLLAVAVLATGTGMTAVAGPTVYIPLGTGNQVIAVDAASDKIKASYPGTINSHGLVATPDGEYLVAGSFAETPLAQGAPADSLNSKLFLVHPAHGHVMLTIPVPGMTHHQAITPDGRHVLSTHPTRGFISVVDMQSNRLLRTIPTGSAPNFTLVTRDGKRAYVTNSGNGTISEVDLVTGTTLRSLEAGPGPEHAAFSHDQQTIYVANPMAGKVSAVSVATGKITRTFPVGKGAHGLDISDDGTTLFASARGEDKLVGIDIQSGKQRTLPLAPAPYHLNTIRGSGKVYVSSSKQPTIWVVDQKSLILLGSIKLPAGEGHQMAVVP